jgi:hypothetical protein
MPTPRSYSKSRSRTTSWQRSTTGNKRTKTTMTYTKASPAYKRARNECEWRMGSYRLIYSQFTGAGTKTPFSPNAANKWIKYVNTGYRVYKWTNRDFCRYFGMQWQTASPTSCYRWMRRKFGACIKDVTRGKGSTWLVATTPTVTARPFTTYTWK